MRSHSSIWGYSIAANDNDARAKNSLKDPVNGKRQQTLKEKRKVDAIVQTTIFDS